MARLVQDFRRDPRFADVVEEGGSHEAGEIDPAQADLRAEAGGVTRDPERVLVDADIVAPDFGEPGRDAGFRDGGQDQLGPALDIGALQARPERRTVE
ncbi:hypothetical protein RHODGE_RHODGE_01073 [Rhodoplanes serenus]|uniref:Uncharacterized protein n=1 Tax=Rhodoplanes serenus TaxID=200615 RepID=A0A447CRY2_9BRAD|nr:hypothetical protein RHODGE_RHODGE_01073 [Rhodoplanes serenus]